MDLSVATTVRRHCRHLAPRPTSVVPVLNRQPGIRAVLFDIYGTLLVSGAGDMTLQTGTSSDEAFRLALAECGLPRDEISELTSGLLQETIAAHHAQSRRRGIGFPEVDIVEVWRDVLEHVGELFPGLVVLLEQVDLNLLAMGYECRVNPVWPMPGGVECLDDLKRRKLCLGIVSNAQAMTPKLLEVLLGRTLEQLGFASDLQLFSYLHGESKPGRRMFDAAAVALDRAGVAPHETVYVGNDMLNDVWAASQVGFRTILFAGDERSLRLRADDERVRSCVPNAIVTDLASIARCLN